MTHVSTEEWSSRLIDRGFSVHEIAAIRGLEVTAVVRHLKWMSRRGATIPISAFLGAETVARWTQWVRARGTEQPPDEPEAPMYWELFLTCADIEHSSMTVIDG